MTSPAQHLTWWSAGLAGLVVIGAGWMWWRTDARQAVEGQAAQAVRRYDLFHPARGVEAGAVENTITQELQVRRDALVERERRLVPSLPDAFLTADLSAAEGLFREVQVGIQQKAQRQGVVLGELPFRSGVEAGAAERRLQLAQLYLVQQMVETALDAGVATIGAVRPGVPFRDSSGHYALIICDYEVSGSWSAVAKLMDLYAERQERSGCGLRNLALERRGDQVLVRCTSSLVTPNQAEWGLATEETQPAAPERGVRPVRRTTRKEGG
jgi:hypothetical protein